MKKELRQRLRHIIDKVPREQMLQRSLLACRQLSETPEYRRAECIMVFLSLPHELDTTPLVLQAWQDSKRVLAPKVIWGERRMLPTEIRSLHQGISENPLGIREPADGPVTAVADLDLVLIPGLGFDGHGNRLGRGRGFYDRFLAHRDYRATSCAIALEDQFVEELPSDPLDRKVDMLVTDKCVRYFCASPSR
jgi:5-formyltetrahydrofolate cyclo-ligase